MNRLVVLPLCARDLSLAEIVIPCIERASTMPGELWIGWNDTNDPPAWLSGPGRVVQTFPQCLGWAGISRIIGQGFLHALQFGYDAAIKMDADTAIIRSGWDTALTQPVLSTPQTPGITGHIMYVLDETGTGTPCQWQLQHCEWIGKIEWPNPLVKYGYAQGGGYAMNRLCLQRIEQARGLLPRGAETSLPEDHLFTLKAGFIGAKVYPNGASALAHEAGSDYAYFVHPIKDPAALRWFCRDILEGDISAKLEKISRELAALRGRNEQS